MNRQLQQLNDSQLLEEAMSFVFEAINKLDASDVRV